MLEVSFFTAFRDKGTDGDPVLSGETSSVPFNPILKGVSGSQM
jgi:hypothetical protein